jgi:hypothetical protein
MQINDAYRKHPDFQFLSVSGGHPDLDSLRYETQTFLHENSFRLAVHYDPKNRTRRGLQGVRQDVVPVTILVDQTGKVANAAIGFDEVKLDQMNLQIASLLEVASP